MIKLIRANSTHTDFIALVEELDAYLRVVDGADHAFYNQYNGIEALQHTVIAYKDGIAAGCGAFKPYPDNKAEVKRMYSKLEYRKEGVATKILAELENWAKGLNYQSCILETLNAKWRLKLFTRRTATN